MLMKRSQEKIMSYFLVFIMVFSYISPIYGMFDVYAEGEEIPNNEYVDPVYPEVSSDKYTLTGLEDLENNTLKVNVNESKVITLETEEEYNLSCSFTGSNFIDVFQQDNTCTISPYNYGKGYMTVTISNYNNSSSEKIQFYIDSEIEDYMDMIINDVPSDAGNNIWSYQKNGININYDIQSCPSDETNRNKICNVEFKYCHNKIGDEEQDCITRTKEITFKNYYSSDNMLSNYGIQLNPGESEEIKVNNYDGDYEDLIWVSENNDIASVDQNGKITANAIGETLVKLYNKNTFEYETVRVDVYPVQDEEEESKPLTINQIVESLKDKKVTIDINHENGIFSYTTNWNVNTQLSEIVPNYKNIVSSYVNRLLNQNSIYNISTNFDSIECQNGVCNFKVSQYEWDDNTNTQVEVESYPITGLSFDFKGLLITNPQWSVTMNSSFTINYIDYLPENSEVTIKYDENYIRKMDNGDYTPLKTGSTEIEIITDGYTDKVKLYINYPYDTEQELANYMNNIKNITLPYSSLSLASKTDLKYLEKILETKILADYPNEDVKQILQSEVTCLSSKVCHFKMYIMEDYHNILGNSSIDRVIKINYTESDTDTINEIKRLDSLIKNIYVVHVDKVIGLEKDSQNDEWFYESLIANTELSSITTSDNLNINFKKIDTFNFKPLVKGGVKYLVEITKDNEVLFTKETVVNANHIVTMPVDLDKNERSTYLKNYVNNLFNVDSSNTLLYDNVYEVTIDEKTFNLILDQKDAVEMYQVDVVDRLFELTTGGTKQIKYKYYPFNGTIGDLSFTSNDESIAIVDAEGNITGVSKGYTFIDVKLGTSINRVLVAVDMSVKEVLNSYLHFIDENITVDYSNLRNEYDTLENAISNKISNNFYNNSFWLPFVADVKVENDKYYAAIGYNTTNVYGGNVVTGDYKEITFDYKGIKLDKYHYDISKGDEVDTKLFFSEGDNNNLYFSYDKEGVIELTKDGKLKGLKPGVANVYINDKYNKYWNYITVTVNFDEFFESVANSLETDKIIVNAIDYGRYNKFSDIVYNKLNERIPTYSLNRQTHFECDEETLTCKFQLLKDYTWNSEVVKEMTFTVEKEGIFVDEFELELDIDEEKEYKFEPINDNKEDVTVKSLNEDICKIEDGKIIGVGAGLCNVKYESRKNLAYQHILVGRNEIITAYETALSRVNDGLEVPLLGFDYNNHNFEHVDMLEYNIGVVPINNKIKQIIGLDTDYYVWAGRTESDEANRYNNMEITVSPNFSFQDAKNRYYYSYYDNTGSLDVKKTVDITPVEINKDDLKIGSKIKEQVKDKYTLSVLQYLRLRLSGKTSGLLEYSDFYELVMKECPTCTIEFGEGGFGGADDMSYVQEGGTYVIFKDYNPIATFELSFEASIDVLQSGEIFNENDYINLIKDIVRDAYLKARKELTGVSRMSTRSINTRRLNDDVEVDVKKEFDPANGQNIYVVTVDDITFKTTAKTEVVGDVNYTYSVTNLELSDESLTLNKGQSKVIGYRVTPDNATNKEVEFKSSNNNVVTVDGNGTVIATGAGTATITVTTKDGTNISKQVNVTVIDNNPSTGGSGEAPSEQQPEIKVLLGDINVDGKINMNDLITLRKYFAGNVTLSSQGLKNVDITKDGKINMNDLIGLRKFLAN